MRDATCAVCGSAEVARTPFVGRGGNGWDEYLLRERDYYSVHAARIPLCSDCFFQYHELDPVSSLPGSNEDVRQFLDELDTECLIDESPF